MYAPEFEGAIHWNDDALNINWPIPEGVQPIVSEKDAQSKLLSSIKASLIWPDDVYH